MPLIQLVEVLIVVGVLPLAGQSVHPDGRVSQVDSECGGGHRSGGVGPESRGPLGFPRQDTRGLIRPLRCAVWNTGASPFRTILDLVAVGPRASLTEE